MIDFRIGNDIPMRWSFFTKDGNERVAYNMEGRQLNLIITDSYSRSQKLLFTVEGNILVFTFWGYDQKHTGEYTLTLVENAGVVGMRTIDKISPFRLVARLETIKGGVETGSVSELEMMPLELESDISESVDYEALKNLPSVNGVVLKGNMTSKELGLIKPFLSLERLRQYLFKITFDKLPDDNGGESPIGGCSSYVQNGKLYSNLDWDYAETAEFIVRTKDFVGTAFIGGLDEGNLNDEALAQLPYRLRDGANCYGIKVATHVLFNDWNWKGCGNKSVNLTRLPFLILSRVKSMTTIADDLGDILDNLYASDGLLAMDYLIQIIITDGTTTYVLMPPTSDGESYILQDITDCPKLANFRWVNQASVVRGELQNRPTGVERWNMMPCDLSELRFTKCYEQATRLSEFIGLRDTTKDSTDEELEAIYTDARELYLDRERDGKTWHTMHSVVYGGHGIESLYIQENWNDNCTIQFGI